MNPLPFTSILLTVSDPSQVGEVRRAAASLAARIGLDETVAGKAAIVATEAATNLQKHAGEGRILLRPLAEEGRSGIEIVAIDGGPGMADIARCMEDGYSTRGTPGNGLGSIKRLAAFLEIYSLPGTVTVLLAQVWDGDGSLPEAPVRVGAISVPFPGEILSGDAWAIRRSGERLFVMAIDGLGHGAIAAEAARVALDLFQKDPLRGPQAVLEALHAGMRSTRGAAGMVLQADLRTGALLCSGVGNIAAKILRPSPAGDRSLISQNGILGHQVKRFQEFPYQWESGAALVVASDGLQTRFALDAYPGIHARHPGIAAALLSRDFRRERDDATVLVLRRAGWGGTKAA